MALSHERRLTPLAAPMAAAVGTVLAILGAASIAPLQGPLHRLMAPEGGTWLHLCHASIVFLFFWSAIDLGRRSLMTARARRSVTAAHDLRDSSLAVLVGGAAPLAESPWASIRSLRRHLENVQRGEDPHRHYAEYRNECEIDRAEATARYGLVRLLAFTMVGLGVIGTTLILDAASGSSSSTLPPGSLGTMVLALVASLTALVAMFVVQRTEAQLRFDAERAGLTILAITPDKSRRTTRHDWGADDATEDEDRPPLPTFVGTRRTASVRGHPGGEQASESRHTTTAWPEETGEASIDFESRTQPVARPSSILFRDPEPQRRPHTPRSDQTFWRPPWGTGSAGDAVQEASHEGETATRIQIGGSQATPHEADRGAALPDPQRHRQNRRAIMWGFGLLFLGSSAAVAAGVLIDRVLIPPDVAVVAMIVGAVFWSMSALSGE